jgi:hypothetical protein
MYCTISSSLFISFSFSSDSRCCPYGPGLLVVSALTTAGAMLLTWIAAFACSFYEADGLGIGLWTVQDPFSIVFGGDECTGWNDAPFLKELLDAPMAFARAMSLIACLSSPLVFVIILLPACMTLPRPFVKGLVVFMFFLSFVDMLCLVSRACYYIRAFTFFWVPWSSDSNIYSRFITGGPGFGYLQRG